MYISENCNWTPYGTNPELDKEVDCYNRDVRIAVAEQGYGFDKLINDEDKWVRKMVAEQGYGFDILINDKDEDVRAAVQWYLKYNSYYKSIFDWAEDNPDKVVTNLDIDEWLNSDNAYKRAEVAKHGYGLDILVNDEDWEVRREVAKQGYSLDELFYDEDGAVRETVQKYLKDNGYKSISDWAKANPDKISH